MVSITAAVFAVIAGLGIAAGSARASLIELDLNTAGDKLITYDDVTGLDWLDVNQTLGLSYNQANATAFVTSQGFRHATPGEVNALYTGAGGTIGSAALSSNFAPALELINKLGCTQGCGGPVGGIPLNENQSGFSEEAFGLAGVPFIETCQNSFCFAPVGTAVFQSTTGPQSRDLANSGIGNYLVREHVVPEPASLALMFGGLAAMAGIRRRRRKS
jgi:hypothetical protein